MPRWRVAELLKEREMNSRQLADQAGISYNTALALTRGVSQRVDLPTLDKVCAALKVAPGDLLEYVPAAAPAGARSRKTAG